MNAYALKLEEHGVYFGSGETYPAGSFLEKMCAVLPTATPDVMDSQGWNPGRYKKAPFSPSPHPVTLAVPPESCLTGTRRLPSSWLPTSSQPDLPPAASTRAVIHPVPQLARRWSTPRAPPVATTSHVRSLPGQSPDMQDTKYPHLAGCILARPQ